MENVARNGLLLLAVFGLFLAEPCGGQSVEIFPPELSRVPLYGLWGNAYWQQLRIGLDHADAASDSAVSVTMPPLIAIADTDGDGQVADEVRVVYDPAGSEDPGFSVSQLATPRLLVVRSVRPAAPGGKLYLQYPIAVQPFEPTASLGQLTVRYGQVVFADEAESDLELGPSVELVTLDEFRALGSMDLLRLSPPLAQGTDTTSTSLGTFFPEQAEVLVQSPADLIFDGDGEKTSNLLGADRTELGDGLDDNDTRYRFFWATAADLFQVDEQVAVPAMAAVGDSAQVYVELEKGEQAVRLLIRDLPAGIHYLYAVSELTGTLPLARSRGLEIRHEPAVQKVGPHKTDITLDSGNLLNIRGEATGEGMQSAEIEFAALDHDDEVSVRLFYSEDGGLESSAVQGNRDGVSALEGAFPIAGAESLPESGGVFTWNVVEPEPVAAGDYFVYAATSDGSARSLRRSERQVRVRHSPYLILDALDDRVISGADTIVTGGTRAQRFVTFTWGRSGLDGDGDLDDDARISLFYSAVPAVTADSPQGWFLPGGTETFLEELGTENWPIGNDIPEDPDGRQGDRFVWDLWLPAEEGKNVPAAGQVLYVYGIIEDDHSRRLVQMNGGRLNDAGSRLVFAHPPVARVLQPVSEVIVKPGRSGRISWEDMDLDSDARIRVLLSEDLGEVTDYAALMEGGALVVNSESGTPAPEIDLERDLSENSTVDYLDLKVDESRVANGIYHAYLAITDGERFDENTRAWRSFGRIEVQDTNGEPLGEEMIELLPQVFSVGTQGEPQIFEMRVDDQGEPIDLLLITLSVDGTFFAVADQDSVADGIQPFAMGAGFSPVLLVTNRAETGEDGKLQLSLEYFKPTGGRISGLDGNRPLATFELISLDMEGTTAIVLEGDLEGGASTHLGFDGQPVATPQTQALAEGALVVGRATVRGVVNLEGRADMGALADFSLRPWASYAPIGDEIFATANDADPEREGVQVQLAEDGFFELSGVPAKRLDLYVHLDGYLDGWAPGLDLFPTQEMDGVVPASPGGKGKLLAGDVAGAADAGGAVGPDNEVTLADWDFVAAFFGAAVNAEDGSGKADITGDGTVNIGDLSLVGANYLERGPRPVYKRLPAEDGIVQLSLSGMPTVVEANQEVELAVDGGGLAGVRAFELELRYATDDWAMRQVAVAGGALVAHRSHALGWTTGAALPGRERDFSGGEPLVVWKLRSQRAGARIPELGSVRLLDRQDREVAARGLAGASGQPLPRMLSLGQNYPNPFNPETTVPFVVPGREGGEPDRVRLEIFDVLGQRVAVLWDGALASGEYQMKWNGRDAAGKLLGSGIYLYRLALEKNRTQVKRMLLVR